MKCVFLLWMLSVARGGTERVGAELANALAERGHEVVIFTRGGLRAHPLYELHPSIHLEYIREKALYNQEGLAEVRRILLAHTPEVVVGFESSAHITFAAALTHGTGIPLILSEHSDALVIENERWNRPDRLAVFSAADSIVLLTEQARQSLPDCLQYKTRVIPNYTSLPAYAGPAERHTMPPLTICSVGRLRDEIKQQTLLIRAFHILHQDFPQWRLCFYGKDDYGEQAGMEALVRELELQNCVFFMGEVTDVRTAYQAAHIFCIPSRYEGFPVVAVEAMRNSIPIVGFAGCRALGELITPACGVLAKEMTPESLAEALVPLMSQAKQRKVMGEEALRKSHSHTPDVVFPLWEQLLTQTAQSGLHKTLAEQNAAAFPSLTRYGMWSTILGVYITLIEKSALFDRAWYRENYVRGPEYMDVLEHFLRFGADKGYRPNPAFDTTWYRQTYVRQSSPCMNPLLHYILWGQKAGYAVQPASAQTTREKS